MLSLPVTLCVAAALLVLVGSLPAPGKPGSLPALALLLGVLCVGAFGLHELVERRGYGSDSTASRRARYALTEIRKTKARNVLLLDGGSFPVCGVDEKLLEKELAALGYSADVVHMAIGGGNHFEREAMYERIVKRLGASKRRNNQNWLYLAEVQQMYDSQPLSQFDKNAESDRVYEYLTPATFWHGLRALKARHIQRPKEPWATRYELFSHMLVNAFNVGIVSRLIPPSKIEGRSGSDSRPKKLKSKFSGMGRAIYWARARAKVPGWLFNVRERRELSIWDGYVDKLVYYGLPSSLPTQVPHITAFCRKTRRPCIAPLDYQLLGQLNKAQYWQNFSHLSEAGAEIYTRWLAKKLVASRQLVR